MHHSLCVGVGSFCSLQREPLSSERSMFLLCFAHATHLLFHISVPVVVLNYPNVCLWFGWLETNLLQWTHISIQPFLCLLSSWCPSVAATLSSLLRGNKSGHEGCARWLSTSPWQPAAAGNFLPAPLSAGQISWLTAVFWSPAWKNNSSRSWAQGVDSAQL